MEDADDISRIYMSITNNAAGTDSRKIIEEYARKQENACFVAEIQGKVVGYIISHLLSGGFGSDRSAWIPLLGVAPKFMGQGIGKKLAEAMFDFYRSAGIKCIYTSVRWDSADLLSFFKTLDFDRSSFINLRKVLD
jgi:ribosomal protein S18 acetylase RimI-like enzyme